MPPEPGKPKRKPPERADNLRVDLPFEEAVRVALASKPPPAGTKRLNRKVKPKLDE